MSGATAAAAAGSAAGRTKNPGFSSNFRISNPLPKRCVFEHFVVRPWVVSGTRRTHENRDVPREMRFWLFEALPAAADAEKSDVIRHVVR